MLFCDAAIPEKSQKSLVSKIDLTLSLHFSGERYPKLRNGLNLVSLIYINKLDYIKILINTFGSL